MARKRRDVEPVSDPSGLQRERAWSGLRAGDAVDVLDARERGAAWTFEAHVSNPRTNETWIEVVGGRRGDERRRSFRPEQVFPAGSLKHGAPTTASLRDAPRLSL
jgi:hypothetical protein